MLLVFVHGWSVTHTNTYGELPEALQGLAPASLQLDIRHIFLGRYISFHDEVSIDDIARAFEQARRDTLGEQPFACVTHSTGGPVMRTWVERYYGSERLAQLPMKHLIMLAPANHGSALAQLGKARVGRIKAWMQGVEPGQGVLNWLELGSSGQRSLNRAWLEYNAKASGFYPFVFTGESIDSKLYDYINSYTGEVGSDGVVRVAAANMNSRYVRLVQNTGHAPAVVRDNGDKINVYPLQIDGEVKRPRQHFALEVIAKASHSGSRMGIMRSVSRKNADSKPVVRSIIECLQVKTANDYDQLAADMQQRTLEVQSGDRYAMVVVQVLDDQGNLVNDYDFYLLGGAEYSLEKLPKGFFVDKQKNRVNANQLTYYLNAGKLGSIKDGKLGIRVVARPDEGFSYYSAAEFRSDDIPVNHLLNPNETLMLDIVLKRHVDVNTFRMDPAEQGKKNFAHEKPSNRDVDS